MLSSSLTSIVAALLLVTNGVYTTPVDLVERAACNKKDYGPFRLYAAPVDDPTAEWQPVKLIDLNIDTAQPLVVCPLDGCGNVPAYFELKNKVLSALLYTDQGEYTVVNKPVVANSTVKVVKSTTSTVKATPEWCAVRSPGSTNGLPGYLSVKGSSEQFWQCRDISPTVRTVRQDIYYKAASGVPNRYCTKVHLVMQSIGIIAEPIPETEVY